MCEEHDCGWALQPGVVCAKHQGTAFDGAAFGSAAVYFPVSAGGSFAGTTLSAPAGVHTVLVMGLTPGAAYSVSVQPAGGGNAITIAPAASGSTADSAGVLE